MKGPEEQPDPQSEGVRLTASASGAARIYQAGRDQHLHYGDGTRSVRRTVSAGDALECPYPGLASFGPEQARWFFGRDRLIADLLARLDGRLSTGGLQAVVAPSGSGKSSLLRAGLLPRLAGGALSASAQWHSVVLTPTSTPMRTLTTAVEKAPPPARRLVVVVDQFEELFTLCSDERERLAYIELLDRLATPEASPGQPAALVVLGIRADFYAACAGYAGLRLAMEDQPLVAGPMTEDELREAIVHPAADVGLDVEPGLVEMLIRDLAGAEGDAGSGRLPFLAHALRMSWQNRHGATMTVEGYRATGGIHHAIATTAARIHDALEPAGRKAAKSVFLRLVKVGDGTEDVRRRASKAELLDAAGDPDAAQAVIDAFTRARLITVGDGTVEIIHEALIRAWPRLRSWIDNDRTVRIAHQHLEETAATWERTGRDSALLYRGSRLEGTRALEADGLSSVGRLFLTASHRHRRRGARLRTAAVAVMTVLTLIATAAAIYANQKQDEALAQRDLAVYNGIVAEADRLRDSDISLSARLSLAAHRMRPTNETTARLLATQHMPLAHRVSIENDQDVLRVAFSPDGRTLAGVRDDVAVRWDVSTPSRPLPLGTPLTRAGVDMSAVAFNPDGRTLASAETEYLGRPDEDGSHERGTITLWDLRAPGGPTPRGDPLYSGDVLRSVVFNSDGRLLTGTGGTGMWRLATGTDPVYEHLTNSDDAFDAVAFSPRGGLLAGSGTHHDGRAWLRLWDVSDQGRPVELSLTTLPAAQATRVHALAFSPDGRVLAGTGFTSIHLWDVHEPARPRPLGWPLTGHTDLVQTLAFSPDGRTLASGGTDRNVNLWNIADPARPHPMGHVLTGHTDTVTSVEFSPDGRVLASAAGDRSIRLWDVTGVVTSASSVAFMPDGRALAVAGDGIRLWDISDRAWPRPARRPSYGRGAVRDVAVAAGGQVAGVVDGENGSSIELWQPSASEPVTAHEGDVVDDITFSPDGRTLAAVVVDGSGLVENARIGLWDVAHPAGPRLRSMSIPHDGMSVAFASGGRVIATTDEDTVHLWDVADPSRPRRAGTVYGDGTPVNQMAVSPDGRVVAVADALRIRLWDVSDPARPRPVAGTLTGHAQTIRRLTFSPDGRTLASAADDGTIRLWDLGSGAAGVLLMGKANLVRDLIFSPDGRMLVSVDNLGMALLWRLDVTSVIPRICAFTADDPWRPEVPYTPPCG